MNNSLVSKFSRSKTLIAYFFLTYLDRVISFALPLSLLFILKNNQLYTFVEVVFSYATILMVVLELGITNFLFYGYKNAENKDEFIENSKIYFKFILFVYSIIAAVAALAYYFFDKTNVELVLLICTRSLFTLFVGFYSNLYRLIDKPSSIYLITIVSNLSSFALLLLAYAFGWGHLIFLFFLPSMAVVIFVVIKFLLNEFVLFKLKDFVIFLKKALKFSWPIIINILAMTYMNNFAKIFAYEKLSQQETLQISYIMRVGLLIQLAHAAFSSFFSKSIFMDEKKQINLRILGRYSLLMLFSTLMAVVALAATNYFFKNQISIPISLSTFLFIFYILLWCFIGYLEIYFGIMNANKWVLYFSAISSVVYSIMLFVTPHVHLFELSLYMVCTATLNLILVLFGLLKLGLLNQKTITIFEK